MNFLRLFIVAACISLYAGCESHTQDSNGKLAKGVDNGAHEDRVSFTISNSPSKDDLIWLQGRWKCVTREYLIKPESPPISSTDAISLDYFNVYFPYVDDVLTLNVTDNPDDRPIAAEFVVMQVVSTERPFQER